MPSPLPPKEEPDEPSDDGPSDVDDFDLLATDEDARWDVFIPDDDELDPLPDPGDFWNQPPDW